MFIIFFNDTATTEIYTLSLHDALPISASPVASPLSSSSTAMSWCSPRRIPLPPKRTAQRITHIHSPFPPSFRRGPITQDRKSTRLNSSHANISYAVFCLKKKTHHHSCV